MNHVKLLLVSTNRADWGHVEPLFKKAQYDPRFKVDVLKVEEGQECQRASVIDDCDIVVFQGDRTELLYYAHRAIAGCKIIAHLAGGERTKGSTDDCVRDAMTKLAHLHYPVHQQAKQRLLELQEEEWRICVAGEVGVDDIKGNAHAFTDDSLTCLFGVTPKKIDWIVAVHPVTNRPQEDDDIVDIITLMANGAPGRIFMSEPNGDQGSSFISAAWRNLQSAHGAGKIILMSNCGHRVFRSLMAICWTIIGNSSALITEAPHLGCLPILIGTRQEGRFPAESDGNACGKILDHMWDIMCKCPGTVRVKA